MLRLYDCYRIWHNLLRTFPKIERYTLGRTIQQLLIELFQLIFEARMNQGVRRALLLERASSRLDLAKLLVRLVNDVGVLKEQPMILIQTNLDEAGRMLGGWIRSRK